MEDYNRIASKYARVLTGLKEILHCLESEEEQQEEKQDEVGSQSYASRTCYLKVCTSEQIFGLRVNIAIQRRGSA